MMLLKIFYYSIVFVSYLQGYLCENDEIAADFDHSEYFIIFCRHKPFKDIRLPRFGPNTKFKNVIFNKCDPPKTRHEYEEILTNLRININAIEEFKIQDINTNDTYLNETHIKDLNVKRLFVSFTDKETYAHVSTGFWKDVRATSVSLDDVVLYPFPKDSQIEEVVLSKGRSEGVFGGCSNLKTLNVSQWEIGESSRDWLSNCTQLHSVSLKRMLPVSIKFILNGATFIQKLVIEDCNVFATLKMSLFASAINLRQLYLPRNFIKFVQYNTELKQLEELDLSMNAFSPKSLASTLDELKKIPTLKYLKLDGNKLNGLCNVIQLESNNSPLQVTNLSLSETGISEICFKTWKTLQFVDLTNNSISVLKMDQLPIYRPGPLKIDLRGNIIKKTIFTKEQFKSIVISKNSANLSIELQTKLDCDCHNGWFIRAVRERIIAVPDLRCENNMRAIFQSPSWFECDIFSCQGWPCTCRRLWSDNTTTATCHSRYMLTVPRPRNVAKLRELKIEGNEIKTIGVDDLPDTLMKLNIHDNRIARVDAATAERLFSVPERQVTLSGNPIVCDCENKPFLDAIQKHHTQVTDYHRIFCVIDGKSLKDLDTSILCKASKQVLMTALFATGGMLLGLVAFLGALYCRYGRALKIFLYARGICLCCMAEDELDADRQYDVFVSFSHDDEKFVVEDLLPELEKEFTTCVHSRNWEVGEMIPTQITRSVESSRRTIIILSKKFVKSLWGLLEFRTAHISALNEGRMRVIVIVVDDVIEDSGLDLQLRGYLLTNTYLKWGDPWFWDKLKYAMPRKSLVEIEELPANSSRRFNGHGMNGEDLLRIEMGELPGLPPIPVITNNVSA